MRTSNQSTRLYSVRDPRGKETTFAYLGSGSGEDRWKLSSRSDRAGKATTFAYNTATRTTTETRPLARVWSYNRYSFAGGNPISFVETDGHEFDIVRIGDAVCGRRSARFVRSP